MKYFMNESVKVWKEIHIEMSQISEYNFLLVFKTQNSSGSNIAPPPLPCKISHKKMSSKCDGIQLYNIFMFVRTASPKFLDPVLHNLKNKTKLRAYLVVCKWIIKCIAYFRTLLSHRGLTVLLFLDLFALLHADQF